LALASAFRGDLFVEGTKGFCSVFINALNHDDCAVIILFEELLVLLAPGDTRPVMVAAFASKKLGYDGVVEKTSVDSSCPFFWKLHCSVGTLVLRQSVENLAAGLFSLYVLVVSTMRSSVINSVASHVVPLLRLGPPRLLGKNTFQDFRC
jgi:hypothetical protein